MRALVGLLSRPVRVARLSTDGILLHDANAPEYRRGKRLIVELINEACSSVRVVPVEVVQVRPHSEGGLTVEGKFSNKLSPDEVHELLA